jgi:hypothetical protein
MGLESKVCSLWNIAIKKERWTMNYVWIHSIFFTNLWS